METTVSGAGNLFAPDREGEMSNRTNYRRGEARRTENGPRYESKNPGAGSNSTHVARARRKWKRSRARAERRTLKERGGLAQLGEHLACNQDVVGSIPTASTKFVAGCRLDASLSSLEERDPEGLGRPATSWTDSSDGRALD